MELFWVNLQNGIGEAFLKLFNLSITAGWLIMAVMVVRLLLKKAPKWISCVLWAIVAVRLLFPIDIKSPFSLIPSAETIPVESIYSSDPSIADNPYYYQFQSGIFTLDRELSPMMMDTSGPALRGNISLFAGIWIIGMLLLLAHALISFLRLHKKVREAIPLRDNIRLCDAVKSPFILGFFRPLVYLPSGMDEGRIEYVLAHEQAHIKRRDHWWKPLGYLLLTVYWFHPLVWAAYILLSRDIELACDESVIKGMDMIGKKAYSETLVSYSMQRRMIIACPLAFGEVGVKKRVKTILKYKKPAFWIIIAAVVACAALAVGFLTNPSKNTFNVKIVIPAGGEGPYYYSDEEISPLGGRIILSSGDGLGDTEVVLIPDNKQKSPDGKTYGPAYMTPGMPVKMDAERGIWYRIGVAMSNPTDKDLTVYVQAKRVNLRIADIAASEPVGYDRIPMVMVGDKYYYDTGRESTKANHSTVMDGEITSSVDGSKIPVKNDQSNFGDGYGYQYGDDNTIEIYMNEKWIVFEYRDGKGEALNTQEVNIPRAETAVTATLTPDVSSLDTDETDALDYNVVIGDLLDTICSDPRISSNPQDYIDAHSIEYCDLLSYGDYTVNYCFDCFKEGNQTGLKGRIMAILCEELLQTEGTLKEDARTAETGQLWYDSLPHAP